MTLGVFRFPDARRRHPEVAAWFAVGDPLRALLLPWYDRLCACDDDIRALVHDGRPTLCAGDAAFAYLAAYARHAAVGFFFGTALDDPAALLEGTGSRMRHVKLRPESLPDEAALARLADAAHQDIRRRLAGVAD